MPVHGMGEFRPVSATDNSQPVHILMAVTRPPPPIQVLPPLEVNAAN
jgi:hypothetical protein